MLTAALQLPPLPTTASAPVRPLSLEAIGVLCVFVLAGLVWLAVGGLVMRSGASSPVR